MLIGVDVGSTVQNIPPSQKYSLTTIQSCPLWSLKDLKSCIVPWPTYSVLKCRHFCLLPVYQLLHQQLPSLLFLQVVDTFATGLSNPTNLEIQLLHTVHRKLFIVAILRHAAHALWLQGWNTQMGVNSGWLVQGGAPPWWSDVDPECWILNRRWSNSFTDLR